MISEQKIRAFLFYLGVFIFLAGLPFILSFAVGYKFDPHKFKFTKTGIIVIKTQPANASVYLNNALLRDKTPLTINELLPAKYNLKIELDKYYSWAREVEVEKGKVSRLEKIILFPLRPHIKQLNKERLSSFWIDATDNNIYYVNQDDSSIYTSNLEGENYKQVAPFIAITPPPVKFRLSPDKQKLLYFNKHQVAISSLTRRRDAASQEEPFILNYPGEGLADVFWHSDSYHLIIISDRKIQAREARTDSPAVDLVNLSRKNSDVFFDTDTDTLYFTDYQQAGDGNIYNNLYKIELNTKTFLLQNLIGTKDKEDEQ
ncbi:MAG: PEGA domain-containing protein [Candidatus Omnitrophica bacterium]|jgi:hypothetical protein|nr:PEGA domain-containing protein [Candidatus Omnitrophota bacterium]